MGVHIQGPQALLVEAGLNIDRYGSYSSPGERSWGEIVQVIIAISGSTLTVGSYVESYEAVLGLAGRIRQLARRSATSNERVTMTITREGAVHLTMHLPPNPDSSKISDFLRTAMELAAQLNPELDRQLSAV